MEYDCNSNLIQKMCEWNISVLSMTYVQARGQHELSYARNFAFYEL
jgi:hypothetical protein